MRWWQRGEWSCCCWALKLLSVKVPYYTLPLIIDRSIDSSWTDTKQDLAPCLGRPSRCSSGGEKRGDPRGRESSVFGASALCDITTGPISCMDPDVATKRGKIHTWILSEGTRHKLLRLLHNMGPLIGFYTQKLSNIFLFSSSCQEISAWFKD